MSTVPDTFAGFIAGLFDGSLTLELTTESGLVATIKSVTLNGRAGVIVAEWDDPSQVQQSDIDFMHEFIIELTKRAGYRPGGGAVCARGEIPAKIRSLLGGGVG
jgi:hypothetical protein